MKSTIGEGKGGEEKSKVRSGSTRLRQGETRLAGEKERKGRGHKVVRGKVTLSRHSAEYGYR